MTKKYRMAEKTSSDGSSGASSPEKSEASAPVTEAKAPVAGAGVAAPPASGDKKKSAEPTVIRTDRVCPNCKRGSMDSKFTCYGIYCSIVFFPIGLICCFLWKYKKCDECGYELK